MYPLVAPGYAAARPRRTRPARSASTRSPASAASASSSTPRASAARRCLLFRLFYAVDLRYGTLVDVARKVLRRRAGRPARGPRQRDLAGRRELVRAPQRSRSAETPPRPLERDRARGRVGARGRRALRPSASAARPASPASRGPSPCSATRRRAARSSARPRSRSTRLVDWVARWVEQRRPQPRQAHALRGDRWPILTSLAARAALLRRGRHPRPPARPDRRAPARRAAAGRAHPLLLRRGRGRGRGGRPHHAVRDPRGRPPRARAAPGRRAPCERTRPRRGRRAA